MTKNELVILISKKAKVPDNLARELFDIFLIRIADKITVGQTAYLENIGYFHLRKGKIRKPEKGLEKETLESHDFIVLSKSSDLNIKSPGNLVLMVPEIEIQNRDEVDSHFRINVEKPGTHSVKDRGTVFRLNQLSLDKRNELKDKVDNIISSAQTEKSISSKHGVLLVEMKKFNKDQLEMNVNGTAEEKETLDVSDDKIDSYEKPKPNSPEEHIEKESSKLLDDELLKKQTEESSEENENVDESDLSVEARGWETVSKPIMEKKIELDKKVYENAEEINSEKNEESNNIQDAINKPILGASDNLGDEGKKPLGTGDENVNRKFKRIKLKGQSIDKKSSSDKKIGSKSIPLGTTDLNQEKKKQLENEKKIGEEKAKKIEQEKAKKIEEEKTKKIEQEKAIINEKEELEDQLEEFENEKYHKVTDGENQMHSEKFKEPSKVKETLATMSELEEDEYAYDTEVDETYRGSSNRSSGMILLIIFGAMIVMGGALYYFLFHKDSSSNDLAQNVQFDNAVSTTYVDRNYDVPVSYPYIQSESEVELHGLSSDILAAQLPKEQSGIDESTTKVISNKETSPPVTTKKVTPPPVTNETKNIPQKVVKDIAPSKNREQVAQNVFKYDRTYAVQVAAFGTKKGAEDGAAKYIKSGYTAFVEEAVVNGKNWYRLRVGGFKTLEEAKQFQKSKK